MDAINNSKFDTQSDADIPFIRKFITDHPTWNRLRLSQELASLWNWSTANGTLRDMACRTYLLKLHRRGLISLPPPQRPANNDYRQWKIAYVAHDKDPIEGSLCELTPIKLISVRENSEQRKLLKYLIHHYHYLGYRGSPGESIFYLIYDRHQRLLACLLFGAAAWSLKSRDQYIGWQKNVRKENLSLIVNNQRFLILPWVKCYNLASHILAQIAKHICYDYQRYFHHPVYLMESFIHQHRFSGTCYQAANWIHVGETTGRTRNDRYSTIKDPIKDIYIYPLKKKFRQLLTNHKFHSLP